jgi:hypothetical protein
MSAMPERMDEVEAIDEESPRSAERTSIRSSFRTWRCSPFPGREGQYESGRLT